MNAGKGEVMDNVDLLTFAELEYLMQGDEGWPSIRAALGLSASAAMDDVRFAGQASLLVRDLARWGADGALELKDTVATACRLLSEGGRWASFVYSAETGTGGGSFRSTGPSGSRLLVLGHSLGAVGVHQVAPEGAAADQFVALTMGMLDSSDPAAIGLTAPEGAAPAVVVEREAGSWFATTIGQSERRATDRPAVQTLITDYVAPLLSSH